MIETSKGFKQVQVSLHLFKDKSGIWRCRGRLSNADIELSAKHFENFAHNIGLRKEGNLSRRSSLNVPCAKDMKEEGTEFHLNHHYQNLFRVTDDFAFTRVGVDFAGPVYVKPIFSTGKNASIFKTYICLFTCPSSQSLHLELVPDPSTKAFICCLLRFMSRRGISNNGKTFKSSELAEFATRNNIFGNSTSREPLGGVDFSKDL